MKVNNNKFINNSNQFNSQTFNRTAFQSEYFNNKLKNTDLSLAAKAYASTQITFKGDRRKLLEKILTAKNLRKVNPRFEEVVGLLEGLGFYQATNHRGSHVLFIDKKGHAISITRSHETGRNFVFPELKKIKEYLNTNGITSLTDVV